MSQALKDLPLSHPRYQSLLLREKIFKGVENGITSPHGLIAHGRGEAFDYLIGEKTLDFALKAINASAACLLLAEHPVISVNGNAAALSSDELVALANVLECPLEVNIFHSSNERELLIKDALLKSGAREVLLPEKSSTLSYIESNRRFVNSQGILKSDCIFVPLEDGDRCEAMVKMGKKVLVVDLNPLSRTAMKASYTIVDNIVRALPQLITAVKKLKNVSRSELQSSLDSLNNQNLLSEAIKSVRQG